MRAFLKWTVEQKFASRAEDVEGEIGDWYFAHHFSLTLFRPRRC
jgi:hypothetical protein